MGSVLITDGVDAVLIDGLKDLGYQVVYAPEQLAEETYEIIHDYVGVVINSKTKFYREHIDRAGRLQFIARLGSGMEIVDVPYAESKGIACLSAPEGNAPAVGEHAVALLMALINNVPRAHAEVQAGQWIREANRGVELSEMTVGIIGFGHTGPAFAQKLAGIGCDILVYDKYKQVLPANHYEVVDLETIYEKADVISLHLPLTTETMAYCNPSFYAAMRKPFYLINTARGKHVPLQLMYDHLMSGKLKGAALDVLENEALNTYSETEKKLFEKIIQHPNVIVTPHIAGWTKESKQRIASVLLRKIKMLVKKR